MTATTKAPKDFTLKTTSEDVKQEGDDGRNFTFVFSSSAVDRDNDVINQEGIDTKEFKKNPIVLWGHDRSSPPVARVKSTFFRDGKLMGSIQFPPEGVSAMSDTIGGLVREGYINAVSIGFRPKEWTFDEDRGGYNILESELLEVSLVPIPSQQEALREAEGKGIDMEPMRAWCKAFLGDEKSEPKDGGKLAEKMAEALKRAAAASADIKIPSGEKRSEAEILESLKAAAARIAEATFDEPEPPVIQVPDGHELIKADGVFIVQPKQVSPEPTPAPAIPKPSKQSRPTRAAIRAKLKGVVVAAVKESASELVRQHTGKLED